MRDEATARQLLQRSRRRAVAALMRHIEDDVYPHLTAQQKTDLRAAVMRSIDTFHEVALDLVSIYADDSSDVVVNEDAMRLLAEIHDRVLGLRL